MTTIMAAVTPTWMISSTSRQSWKNPLTLSISRALLASLSCLGDSQKLVRLEARAADQRAIDIGGGQQLGGIATLHRATIEQAHGLGIGDQPAQHLANMRMRCGHLRGGRCLARADRPDRLIDHDELCRGCPRRHAALELGLEHAERLAGLALVQRLADADDRQQPGPPCRLRLGPYLGIGLSVIGAPLGMADDDMARPGIAQHLGRDVAGMGAARLGMAILAAHQYAAALHRVG